MIDMKYELSYLLTMFGEPEYDWLNFKVTEENPITFHHIKRVWEGGEDLVTNGALLTYLGHRYLHEIEKNSPLLYKEINLFLQEVNNRLYPPTIDELNLIDEELLNYEAEYNTELNSVIKFKKFNEKKVLLLFDDKYHPTNIRLNLQQGIYIYNDNYLKNQNKGKKKRKYRNSSYTSS